VPEPETEIRGSKVLPPALAKNPTPQPAQPGQAPAPAPATAHPPEQHDRGSLADPLAAYRARLARPGYFYVREFAEPLIAQLARADLAPDARGRLTERLEAMFAVSHSPDGGGLTEVKAASNRYHAELGARAIAELHALTPGPDPARQRAVVLSAAERIAQRTDALLEDGVHMTIALDEAQGARVRIAPNFWEVVVAFFRAIGPGALYDDDDDVQPPAQQPPPPDPAIAVMAGATANLGVAVTAALGAGTQVAALGGDRHQITANGVSPFVVRLMACPLGRRVVRPVVNPSKDDVIQLSRRATAVQIGPALAQALCEIGAIRRAAQNHQLPVDADYLTGGAVGAFALSPHDHGGIAQLNVIAAILGNPLAAEARREHQQRLHLLIDQLGLRRDGTALGGPGAVRAAAINALLTGAARNLVAHWSLHDPDLGRVGAQTRIESATLAQAEASIARKERAHDAPLHQPAIQNARRSRAEAAQLADAAGLARAQKSGAVLARYRGLADQARPNYHRVTNPQIGGGAALAAIRSDQMLIDDRGRWQRDRSADLAQTAAQLRWVKDAGIGDPYEFVAEPNDRVPIEAVRYWEDSIAAQADVINGTALIQLDPQNRQVIRIAPSADGVPLVLEVGGTPTVATGFPPETIPRPRNADPAAAKQTLLDALQAIGTALALAARGGLAALDPSNDAAVTAWVGGADAGVLGQLRGGAANVRAAIAVFDAPAAWAQHHRPDRAQPRVLTGDEANLDTLDPLACDTWMITGVGGTGISAAEIILDRNPHSRVTMIGGNATPGLFDNVQARRVIALHGPGGSNRFQVITGQQIGGLATPDGGATFSAGGRIAAANHLTNAAAFQPAQIAANPGDDSARRWLVAADVALVPAVTQILQGRADALVTIYGNRMPQALALNGDFLQLLEDYGPVSGNIRLQTAMGGFAANVGVKAGGGFETGGECSAEGYIAAMGRTGSVAPPVKELIAAARRQNYAITADILFDRDEQYLGYRITVTTPDGPRSVEVTGAASRFPPTGVFTAQQQEVVQRARAASAVDAPTESGNFDGGFAASAMQAARYGRDKRAREEARQLDDIRFSGAMGQLVLAQGQQAQWPQTVQAFLARELRLDAARIDVRALGGGASGDVPFMVRVGEVERVFKVFDDRFGNAQNEIDQLRFIASLHLEHFQGVGGQQGVMPSAVNGQGQRGGVLMEMAEGESVEHMIEHIPAANPLRRAAMLRIIHASEQVATALAEFHHATSQGAMTQAQKSGNGSDANNVRARKLPALQPDLTQAYLAPNDFADITNALGLTITAFENAPVPASAYHGDANAGNFILDGDRVQVIDVGYMRWSHGQGSNVGTATGANDLARFVTSLETLHPGRLTDEEVGRVRVAFYARYFQAFNAHGHNLQAADMTAAIRIYRVETEIAAYNGAVRALGQPPNAVALQALRVRLRDRLRGALNI
jgi:hypothetical protein